MDALLQLFSTPLILFLLVLTRVTGLFAMAPVWSSPAIAMRIRLFLAVGLSLIIVPLMPMDSLPPCATIVDLALLASRELFVGLCLGLGVRLCFVALQLAGQVMGQMSGMSLTEVVDPTFQASVPVFGQLLHVIMLAVFLAIGGHRMVLDALLSTFEKMPAGQAGWSPAWVDVLTQLLQSAFVLGIQIAAPAMVALLLSMLIMGLISRTLPQLNILAVGFSINGLVMLAALLFSLGVLVRVFQTRCVEPIELLRAVLGAL